MSGLTKLGSLSDTFYRKALLILGHFFFLSYLIGSLYFYRERIINFDSAYYTFHLLVADDFFIKHDRWISYFTQWIPLLVQRSGGSLQAVLMSYSAAFAVWFYIIFLIIVYGFRNIKAGVFYALAMGLCIRYKYYAAISEITFSLALAAMLMAYLTSSFRPAIGEIKAPFWGGALVISLFMYGSHPVIIFPLIGFFAIDLAYHRRWRDYPYWAFIAFLVLLYAYTFWELSSNQYEQKRIGMLGQIGEVLKQPQKYTIYHILKRYVEVEYAFPLALTFGLSLVWLWQKRFLTFFFFTLLNVAWLAINIGTYAYLRNHMYIMIDGYLAVFGLIWAIPYLFILLRSKYRSAALLICSVLIIFSLSRIYQKHEFYTQRHAYLLETLAMNVRPDQKKMILSLDHFDWDKLWYPYQVPHETLMLSALKHPDSSATIFVNYEYIPMEDLMGKDKDGFLHYDHNYALDSFPKQFFNLPVGEYQVIDRVAW